MVALLGGWGRCRQDGRLAQTIAFAYISWEHTRSSMDAIIWLINTLFSLYWWVILAMVVMSWLLAFNIINAGNPYVRQVGKLLRTLTEPVLGPIRRIMPDLGGIDISPIILLIAMEFIRRLIVNNLIALL
jgi:YggT family protein